MYVALNWDSVVKRCKQLLWEWISNEIPLDSTGHDMWSLMKEKTKSTKKITTLLEG